MSKRSTDLWLGTSVIRVYGIAEKVDVIKITIVVNDSWNSRLNNN